MMVVAALEHRVGHEVGHPAQAQETKDNEQHADDQGQRECERQVLLRTLDGQRADGRG
jgi:hypothetical protein